MRHTPTPADTRIAIEVGGTELSTNMAMPGGLMGIADLVSFEALRESIQERFGGGKFVASGTTPLPLTMS